LLAPRPSPRRLGAIAAYITLNIPALTSSNQQTVRAAYLMMLPVAWYAIVPLAAATLLTGIVLWDGTHLTGIDLSPAMLDIARDRARQLGHDVTLRTGDAQALDFPRQRLRHRRVHPVAVRHPRRPPRRRRNGPRPAPRRPAPARRPRRSLRLVGPRHAAAQRSN
jgi:SAM-dependent methyltransferase